MRFRSGIDEQLEMRSKFRRRKWLPEQLRRWRVAKEVANGGMRLSGDRKYAWRLSERIDPLNDLAAIHTGQANINNHRIIGIGYASAEEAFSVGKTPRLLPQLVDKHSDRVTYRRIIF